MMTRLIIPFIFGLVGATILVSLGLWQIQRLQWKQSVLSDIEDRIMAVPVAVPLRPDPRADRYLPVIATGVVGPEFIRILASQKRIGAGYRVISPLQVGTRSILLDRGFVKHDEAVPPSLEQPVKLVGNLHWPDEVDRYTPKPDYSRNIWFARDLPALAAALKTEPVLFVLRQTLDPPEARAAVVSPLPVDTKGIPNDHLQYAITWFLLAAIWLFMTGYFITRNTSKIES